MIKYFKELLETLKRIESHLDALEGFAIKDHKKY